MAFKKSEKKGPRAVYGCTYNRIVGTTTTINVEQFLDLPKEQQERYDLVEGNLIEVLPTTLAHDWIRDTLMCELANLADATAAGIAQVKPWLLWDSNNLFCADGGFWDSAHVAQIEWRKAPNATIPQLVWEVVSPTDSFAGPLKRARLYQHFGVHTVWVINEDPFEIHVFEGPDRYVIRTGGKLETPVVLPGFSLAASALLPPE